MNYAMSDYPHCVVLERCVYVGGGATGLGDDDEYCIKYTRWMLRSGVVYQDIDTGTLL